MGRNISIRDQKGNIEIIRLLTILFILPLYGSKTVWNRTQHIVAYRNAAWVVISYWKTKYHSSTHILRIFKPSNWFKLCQVCSGYPINISNRNQWFCWVLQSNDFDTIYWINNALKTIWNRTFSVHFRTDIRGTLCIEWSHIFNLYGDFSANLSPNYPNRFLTMMTIVKPWPRNYFHPTIELHPGQIDTSTLTFFL